MRLLSRLCGISTLLTLSLSAGGCAFLIPDNPSTPRYNTLLGERRMPKENAGMMKNGAAPAAVPSAPIVPPEPMVQAAPLPPVANAAPAAAPEPSMALPPVDPQTQRIADAQLADAAQAQGRSVPAENLQLASNDYPVLSEVPPAPPVSGDASAAQRLSNVRRELEQQRTLTEQAKTQLERDAAAEPSMLSELPNPSASSASVPAPLATPALHAAPVVSSPNRGIADLPPPPPPLKAAPAPMPAPAPAPGAQAPIPMDQLPMGQAAPPPAAPLPIASAPAAPAPMPLSVAPAPAAPSPAQTAGLAPIQLRPPGSAPQGFDPMADSSGPVGRSVSYASTQPVGNFLPPSRYAYRR